MLPFLDILKVVQPGVVVVLAFEDGLIDAVGVDVSNGMAVGVPSPKAYCVYPLLVSLPTCTI